MEISREKLMRAAKNSGFRPEILEKVWILMTVLDEVHSHPFLNERLVLKGGTALNLFVFNLPRLSVDIDLNYIGELDREKMLKERPNVETALESVCDKIGLKLTKSPNYHAGGKFQLVYRSALEHRGNLEVDLNYLYRIPLLKAEKKCSLEVAGKKTSSVLILAAEELAAGKLIALFSRNASRDLFDSHYLLNDKKIDPEKLKLTFLAYGIMSSLDLRILSTKNIGFETNEFERKLIPVLNKKRTSNRREILEWGKQITKKCQESLDKMLNFTKAESLFLEKFYNAGEVDIELLTSDKKFAKNLNGHPLLKWRKQQLLNQ